MTDQIDFIALYRELGIEPTCSIDRLRLAYRRRVAGLHPDRGGDPGQDELKSLNLRYAAALEFHRHYGRLPGASPASFAPLDRSAIQAPRFAGGAMAPGAERRGPSRTMVYGMLVVAALLVWWLSRTGVTLPGILGGVAMDERRTPPPTAMSLRTGMHAGEVVSILGDPVSRELGDTHWEYGPSWVRFECGRVVDWYSSPLNPLRASRSRPDGGVESAAHYGPRRCPAESGRGNGT